MPRQKPGKSPTNISETLQTLSTIKAFVKDAGGSQKAQEQIATIKQLSDSVGGLAQLKEAIKTLEEWSS